MELYFYQPNSLATTCDLLANILPSNGSEISPLSIFCCSKVTSLTVVPFILECTIDGNC